MTRPFSELRDQQSPERRAQNEAKTQELLGADLARLRADASTVESALRGGAAALRAVGESPGADAYEGSADVIRALLAEVDRLTAALFASERFRAEDAASHIDEQNTLRARAVAAERERDEAQSAFVYWHAEEQKESRRADAAEARLRTLVDALGTLEREMRAWPQHNIGSALLLRMDRWADQLAALRSQAQEAPRP